MCGKERETQLIINKPHSGKVSPAKLLDDNVTIVVEKITNLNWVITTYADFGARKREWGRESERERFSDKTGNLSYF